MDFEEEYKQNRTAMKRIKKEDTVIFIVFAVNMIMAIWLFIAFFMSFDKKILFSSIFGAAASVIGFLSAYRKDSALAIVSGVFLVAEMIGVFFFGFVTLLGFVLAGVFIVFAVRNFNNIKKYKWLEQQDGFPQFEPKLKEYDMNRVQRSIKDPYAIKMEERQRSSYGNMDEI
ncbi:hypothetical protein [Ruminococcus flavefaciens]|uniref:Uncharacterized protein n=1 Tax=Ruminococcus flavefaciens TaxID=1265 RepID=A0A1M7IP25_RUMFL|nr:hypothetical protein [Ruminococcus flavefaciens]SHM42445.1 hypothetical protein SAMN04487860_104232 [Ruminococcus flavefaciens]